jgi:hypothetical protein
MRRVLFAAAGIAALSVAGFAMAQDQNRGPFRNDANNDGVVTRQEFDAGHAARFAEMDANHDGQLARGEGHMRQRGGPDGERGGHHRRMGHHGGGLRGADANNDGNITREEFLARPTEMFNRLDANHDGVIQASERPQRRERAEGGERHARVRPDADNNGTISQAEFAAMGGQMFERMDANHDGRITREEAQAQHGHRRQPAD